MSPIPNRLREFREGAGLTQQELAEQVGAGRVTIIRAEQGTQSPTLELADRLADVLGTTIDELFGDPDREAPGDAYWRGWRDGRADREGRERADRGTADRASVDSDTAPDPADRADRGIESDTEDLGADPADRGCIDSDTATMIERVPAARLNRILNVWKQLQAAGWSVTALRAPDSRTVVLLACRGSALS